MWNSQMNQIHTVTTATSIKVHFNTLFLSSPKRSKDKMYVDFASWKKCLPSPKAKKNKIGSQSLPINIKACKYQGGICGGKESHRIVINQWPTTLLKEFNRSPSRNSEPDSPARKVVPSKGYILLKNPQTPFLIPETVFKTNSILRSRHYL